MTLKEIAAELGVSTSTVSRVLNGCHKNFTVKPELRKRILDRVAERNYRPNPMYQAMRKKENLQIAICRKIFKRLWKPTSAAASTP